MITEPVKEKSMAEVKGKFITLACTLLETKPEAKQAALDAVTEMTGRNYDQLDPEGWYDTMVFDAVFRAIEEHSSPALAWAAIRLIGAGVYPLIERTAGLPTHLKTPLDFIKYEAEGFELNHRGDGVQPRKFVKADTGDTRESPGIYVTRQLLRERAEVVVSDPQALDNAKIDLADVADQVEFVRDPYEACEGAHAIAILTEWRQYRDLDFERIYDSMVKPACIFDGRNILDHKALYEIGFNVYPIGKPELSEFS